MLDAKTKYGRGRKNRYAGPPKDVDALAGCHHRFEAKREKRQINFVGDKSWKVNTEKYIKFYKTIL